MKPKLVVFDLDGVLVDIESSWCWVHKYFGVNNDESLRAYLKGEIDDEEFMKRDIALWLRNGKLKLSELGNILREVPLMGGAKETVSKLSRAGIKTAIISGGLELLATRVKKELGIDYSLANGLAVDRNGFLCGEGILKVALVDKSTPLKQLMNSIGVEQKECVAVGNSRFDCSLFEASGLSIAFNPCDDEVRASANVVIEGKDLSKILPYILAQRKY